MFFPVLTIFGWLSLLPLVGGFWKVSGLLLEMDFILVGEPHDLTPDIRRGEILPD